MMHCCCGCLQIKVERMAQESRVQKAIQEQEKQFGKMTRSISGTSLHKPPWRPRQCTYCSAHRGVAGKGCMADRLKIHLWAFLPY